jgi:hypothetical protein
MEHEQNYFPLGLMPLSFLESPRRDAQANTEIRRETSVVFVFGDRRTRDNF